MNMETLPPEVVELLEDAATRHGMGIDEYIRSVLDSAASEEYARQQCETERTYGC